jgi:dolichyl-phosphate-mannose--protein O-mannosyl transferase
MIFDEIYHARTAYEHLNSMPVYEWTHPPLGKLLISTGILLFGMNPFGWRIAGALFGVAMIPLMYMFGLKVFRRSFYAFCCSFLIMFDFMHFGLSRIATVDIYAAFFIILMYYFIYQYCIRPTTKHLFFCGLFFGIGAACKWITLYAAGGIALLIVFTQYRLYRQSSGNPQLLKTSMVRTFFNCISFFIVIPAIIYCLSYLPYFFVPNAQNDIGLIWRYQSSIFKYHSQYVLNATHPYSSEWLEWPLFIKPLVTYAGESPSTGISSTMAILGNPAIWWAGIAAVFAAIASAWKKKDIQMSVVFVAVAFQYLPWAFVPRITFIYHFFSSVPFIIFCIVYCIKTLTDSFPKAVYAAWGYLAVVFALFVMFFPVLSGLEVSRDYVNNWLHWVDGWNF